MANTKSSKKSFAKSTIQRQSNNSRRSMLRTFIKKMFLTISTEEKKTAQNKFSTIQKIIDQQSAKGLIHKNKASRLKSNIHAKIKNMKNTSS